MQLTGSKTERDYRLELQSRHDRYLTSRSDSRLKQVLESLGEDVSSACVLEVFPDENEDNFLVLLRGTTLLRLEIERHDETIAPVVERVSLQDYTHKLSKSKQIQLLVAQDLTNSET